MMDPHKVKSIFLAAAERPRTERSAFLNEIVAGDVALRDRLEALLAAHDDPNTFLDQHAADFAMSDALSPPSQLLVECPGTSIGPYKLLEQIGEGGMGAVFMAEQQTPVRRRVAIKIIKAGMDTRQVIARFEAERQALALMDHANIARVLDAGATESGRPYFVMELVRGVPITEYCDQNNLSVCDRLELFVQVCYAVQHAHQKGIIHRDLKPTNVLVTVNDGRAVPKVIDFGVAKASSQQLTEKTLFTAFAQMIGTPLYMSPEQAEMSSVDIDTRSDIYSLGVLLYELMTGTTPFDRQRMREAPYDEMLRILRVEEPPLPSTRISTLGDERISTAAQRRTDPRKLSQSVAGDLDWIVMKSLEKDRSRRYDTASGLAEDIHRYLSDQPVEARSPTRLYRLQKFIRRHRVGVLAGSAIAVALLVGMTLATIGFVQARRQAEIARIEASRSEQVAQFLKDMLKGVGPSVALGNDTKMLRGILDKTAARVQEGFEDNPAVQAELCYTLGITYEDLDEDAKAEPMYQKAVEQYRRAFGQENTHVALGLGRLGVVQDWLNRGSDGRVTSAEAVRIARKIGDKGVLAHCLYCYAGSLTAPIITSESAPFLREAVALEKEVGDDPSFLAKCLLHLGASLDDPPTRPEAESLMREALALHRAQAPPDNAVIANDLFVLGQCLLKEGKLDEAEAVARENVDFSRRVYDKDHINREFYLGLLGHVLIVRGKWEEAEAMFKAASDSSPSNGRYWEMLGDLNGRRGHWEAAVKLLTRSVDLSPAGDHYNGAFFLAVTLVKAGQLDEYRAHCRRFLEWQSDPRDHYGQYLAAVASLMLPVDGADLDRACQYADSGAVREQGEPLSSESTFCKALAEYRRGHLVSAIDWGGRATTSSDDGHAGPAKAAKHFIVACANATLRDLESGRAALARGDDFEKTVLARSSSDFSDEWADWAVVDRLRREAADLLAEKPAVDPNPAKRD